MRTLARLALEMNADEVAVIAEAAASTGSTIVDYVHAAAIEKAQALLEDETRLTLSGHDFGLFTRTLDAAFARNPALKESLGRAHRDVRRARGTR